MQYETQIPIGAASNDVLTAATKLLLSCGFNLTSQSENEVTLAGPGMRSTNQNPILGATEISLRQSHTMRGKIAVVADLGGVRWMQKFMTILPLSLMGLFATLLIVSRLVMMAVRPQMNFPPGVLLMLGIIGATFLFSFGLFNWIMTKRIRKNTENAIDACINNADALVQRER